MIALTGSSQSGRIFSDREQDEKSTILAEYLNQVIESRQAWTCGGTLAHIGREHMRFESIDCPLAEKDGRVTHILGVMVKVEA